MSGKRNRLRLFSDHAWCRATSRCPRSWAPRTESRHLRNSYASRTRLRRRESRALRARRRDGRTRRRISVVGTMTATKDRRRRFRTRLATSAFLRARCARAPTTQRLYASSISSCAWHDATLDDYTLHV
ncbi:hypothetical protein EXIGLDRAFT_303780 [Exidia glandulosa HHB12029]|uniref:Uncharacterized protein n=1 Tax=Exidia glandulosa HHB12029 TaxID=1314781 RepID=A0A165D610_EXIGL|nr:hypothetical protein EXIGLDRAFT_303780 [Exidia glandulosa HHB12029]